MLYKLILPMFLVISTIAAQSPKYLVLKNRDTNKEVAISEGEIVVVRTFKGEKIAGKMEVISETLIRVKHKIVPLTNVASLGRRNQRVLRVASLIVSTGMNLFLYGISEDLRNGWGEISKNHKASVPMLAVGIPLLTITLKRRSKNWTYKGAVGVW